MTRITSLALVAISAVVVAACGTSNPAAPDTVPTAAVESPQAATTLTAAAASHEGGSGVAEADHDVEFVSYAEMVNQAHLQIGQLIEQNGDHPEVKQLGLLIASDHREARQTLRETAGDTVPQSVALDASYQQLLADLRLVSGSHLDRVAVPRLIETLRNVMDRFRTAAAQAQSPDVRTWADSMLGTLDRHLRVASRVSTMVP